MEKTKNERHKEMVEERAGGRRERWELRMDGWTERRTEWAREKDGCRREGGREGGREETKRGRKDGYKNEGMEDRRKEAIVEEWRNG